MEAVINECPAFAMSQEYYQHPDFALASRMAQLVAVNILEHGLGPGELLNVNVPAIAADELDGIEVTRMGKRIYQDQLIERLDPRGVPYYWIGGPAPSGHAEPGTDFHAVVNRRIAVTPIQLDLTADRLLRRLDELVLGAAGGRATVTRSWPRRSTGREWRPLRVAAASPPGRRCWWSPRCWSRTRCPPCPGWRYRRPRGAGSRSARARCWSRRRW